MSDQNRKTFNLVDEPWIPVAGEKELRSLWTIFSNPPPRRLSGNPVEKIVLFRFLLSIAHASVKISDVATWKQLTSPQLATFICKYLEVHHDLFDLYDTEKPFLQFPQLALKGKVVDCSTLKAEVATGNNLLISEWHKAPKYYSDAEKVLLLLCACGYSRGGKQYDKTHSLTEGYVKKATGRFGTLLGNKGYLHSYIQGDNLWDSLLLNMLTEQEIKDIKFFNSGLGSPCWENMPQGEDDTRAREYRQSYFGRLFPLDKFLLYKEKGVIRIDGISYDDLNENILELAVTTINNGKKEEPIWANTTTRPWRQLLAILAFLRGQTKSPYTISFCLQKLKGVKRETISVWSCGAEVSSKSGEQYFSGKNDYIESEFLFPVQEFGEQSFVKLEKLMQKTDEIAKILHASVTKYHELMNNGFGSNHATNSTTLYWERMEKRAQVIIDIAFANEYSEEEADKEIKLWYNFVYQIYDELCPNNTARQMDAYVQANPRNKKDKKNKK